MDKSPIPSSVEPQPTHPTAALTPFAGIDALDAARFWGEWVEAGRLWMSWWMNSLPTMPWPPAGVVLPPPLPERPLQTQTPQPQTAAAPTLPAKPRVKSPAAQRNRASSARHQ